MPTQQSRQPVLIHADESLEWYRDSERFVARGGASAAQGDVEIRAETLTGHYRKNAKTGVIEIWRIVADRNVRLITPTQKATGIRGVYNVDTGVMVLDGPARLDTETDRITAHDTLEFRERQGVAIASGKAMAVRGKSRLRAEVLTATIVREQNGKAEIQKIKADGGLEITTRQDVIRSSRGVYDLKSGVVTLTGSVKITRGRNQLNGDYAEVNLNTGRSKIVNRGGKGVRGLLIPAASPVSGGQKK